MFNQEQLQAINHQDGPLIVVAGPGSGKTTVVINRTAKMIANGIDPENILVITFTKAAAKEMQTRFHALAGENVSALGATFCTIHSIALKILVESFGYTYDNVLGEREKWGLLNKIVKEKKIHTDDIKTFLKNIINAISRIKTERLAPPYDIDCGCRDRQLEDIYHAYTDYCTEQGKIDYDDMQILCLERLKKDPDVLQEWRDRYQYISVDEAQDMDYIQAELIYLLAKPRNNICIVGDDDQSLYQFRGAKPEIMLMFEKEFNAERITLDTNYRSGERIVRTTSDFIKNNKIRFDKDFKFVRPEGRIFIDSCNGTDDQACRIALDIKSSVRKGTSYDDIAVIYRTNSESSKIVAQFMKQDIPFVAKAENIVNIFEHWIFADIANFYELSHSKIPYDWDKVKRALKRPTRYIPNDAINKSRSLEDIEGWGRASHKPYIGRNIREFRSDLKTLGRLPLHTFLAYLVNDMDYRKAVMDYADYNRQNPQELINILDEIIESAKEFTDYKEWYEYSRDYTIALQNCEEDDQSGVRLLTMHSSKGLEFKQVYIIDANEGITPYAYKGVINDLEEERRMFYVAMTRAKDSLHIYSPAYNNGKKVKTSCFVTELQKILAVDHERDSVLDKKIRETEEQRSKERQSEEQERTVPDEEIAV